MENEALVPKITSESRPLTQKEYFPCIVLYILVTISLFIAMFILTHGRQKEEEEIYVPNITIPSMDFTVLNITETSLTVKWNILIRIPRDLRGRYMCLIGHFQVFVIYKGVTIATSSIERYNMIPWWRQLLSVSLIASEDDMDSVIMKDIMGDIKEIGEIRFGSRLLLPDCRFGTSGKMNYACDEAMLRFEPGYQRNATLFGNHTICHYLP